MDESEIKSRIVAICRRLNARNCLAAADGNVSYRVSDQEIIITESGINKADLDLSQFAVINLRNETVHGTPSSERLMHLEVFRRCPEARAVVHAHPPTAIAWTIARPDLKELPADCMSELILAVGSIPIVPYARPGTHHMADALAPFLPESRVMILSRHGAVSWGETLDEAYNGIERLEHAAIILKSAVELGGLNPLPADEIAGLREMRRALGDRTL